ncbi:MAG: hypothetical protein AB7P49_02370 [Bdellovibrionales bacterium]
MANAITLPMGQVGDSELYQALPNEKVLVGILYSNAVGIIVYLAKFVWDGFTKKSDKTAERVEELHKMIHDMQGQLNVLAARMPNEAEIISKAAKEAELMYWRERGKGREK